MADFVAILKKTIESQDVNTPELRARIYARARQTIEQKLDALVPAPTAEQKARQLKALEEAVGAVEASYALAGGGVAGKIADPLEVFISEAEAASKSPVPKMPEAKPFTVAPAPAAPLPSWSRTTPTTAVVPPSTPKPPLADTKSNGLPGSFLPPVDKQKRSGGLVWAIAGALLAAGLGYGAYTQRETINAYLGSFGTSTTQPEVKKVATTSVKASDQVQSAEKPAAGQTPAATPAKVESGEVKFTQRLTEDGKEVDSGPAVAASGVGEGESVAQVTTPPDAKPAVPDVPSVTDPATPTEPVVPEAVAVGQKAVFYEEKTGTEEGTVDQGAVVWSVVQDSPAADQPAEAVIRAEIDIPDKGVKLKLTIKRNGDKTLPASHIIEMAFSTPEGFEGGSIEGVQRVTFKDTEQAPGNPLVGVPANFGDGFFLIALTDEKTAIEANLALMTRQSWIDIPLTYKSGRRALISIEKGIPGDKVFQEVLKAWQGKASG